MKTRLIFSMCRSAVLIIMGTALFGQTYLPLPLPEINGGTGNGGALLNGAYLCTFAAGTSTPQLSYSDSSGTHNTNPIVLDSNGHASVWVSTLGYKLIMYTGGNGSCPGSGTVVWSQDNVYAAFPQVTALNTLTGSLTLAGTTNQVTVVNGGSTITLGLPQSIATSSSVTFANVAASASVYVTGAYPDGMNAPVFSCSATGSQLCMTQGSDTFNITGAGNGNFQTVTAATGLVVGTGPTYGISSAGVATLASIGAGMPGSTGYLIFNSGGAAAANSNLSYSPGANVLTISGSGSQGLATPLVNCTNTGSTACIQSAASTFAITGAGNAAFQNVAFAGTLTTVVSAVNWVGITTVCSTYPTVKNGIVVSC